MIVRKIKQRKHQNARELQLGSGAGGWGGGRKASLIRRCLRYDGGEAGSDGKPLPEGRGQVSRPRGRHTWICLEIWREPKQPEQREEGTGGEGKRGPSHR